MLSTNDTKYDITLSNNIFLIIAICTYNNDSANNSKRKSYLLFFSPSRITTIICAKSEEGRRVPLSLTIFHLSRPEEFSFSPVLFTYRNNGLLR